MKKRLFIMFAVILCMFISLSAFTISAAGEETEPSLKINGANLSFESTVHMLYSVEYTGIADPENIRLLVWRGSDVNVSECTKGTETAIITPYYTDESCAYFDYDAVAAAEMTEDVYVRAYAEVSGTAYDSPVVKYSVLHYAHNKLGITGNSGTEDENLKAMLIEMLEYGAAAQVCFNVNTDRLASANYSMITVSGTTLEDGYTSGLYVEGSKLVLTAEPTAEQPYVIWTDENGDTVGTGNTLEVTVGADNATYNAKLSSTNPEYVAKQEWNADGKLKILAIGNSYAINTLEWLAPIAVNEGVEEITVACLYIGGCDLDTHLSNAQNDSAAYTYYYYNYSKSNGDSINTNVATSFTSTSSQKISDIVKSDNWDFISLQQASSKSGVESSYSVVSDIIDIVEPMCPAAKLIWNMTWAYAPDYTDSSFATYNYNSFTMYNAIVAAVQNNIATNESFDIIVPTGTAVQNARYALGVDLSADGTHLSWAAGRYVAAMTMFSSLTGTDPTAITHTSSHPYNDYSNAQSGTLDSNAFISAVRNSVADAINNPYETTAKETPEEEEPVIKPTWNADGTLNILVLGDTKTSQTLEWLSAIVKHEGIDAMTIAYANNGGTTIADHTSNYSSDSAVYTYGYNTKTAANSVSTTAPGSFTTETGKKLSEILADKDWDFIVFQQEIWSGASSNSYSSLATLASDVAAKCPNAKLAFSMMYIPASSSDTTYNSTVSAVMNSVATLDNIDIIIPLATAIKNAETYIGLNIVTTINLNYGVGRYVAALSIYCSLLEVDATSLTHAPANSYNSNGYQGLGGTELSQAEYFELIRQAVKNAADNPYALTALTEESTFALYKGYYNSVNSGTTLINNDGLLENFYATEIFTPETLPVGSVITIGSGFRVRPERWTDGVSTARGENTTLTITVTEEWWGSYNQAAFNISRTDGTSLTDYTEEDIRAIFTITFPN